MGDFFRGWRRLLVCALFATAITVLSVYAFIATRTPSTKTNELTNTDQFEPADSDKGHHSEDNSPASSLEDANDVMPPLVFSNSLAEPFNPFLSLVDSDMNVLRELNVDSDDVEYLLEMNRRAALRKVPDSVRPVTIGATTFSAEHVWLAGEIIDAQEKRLQELAATERELESITNAKVHPDWLPEFEKFPGDGYLRWFGKLKERPDEFVVVAERPELAVLLKEHAIRESGVRFQDLRRDVLDFEQGRYRIPDLPDLYVGRLKVGRIGNLSVTDQTFKRHILYGVCRGLYKPTGPERHKVAAEVLLPLPKSEVLVRVAGLMLCVRGISAKDKTTYSEITLAGPYRVVGTKSFNTVVGGESVTVIEPYVIPGMTDLVKYLQSQQ